MVPEQLISRSRVWRLLLPGLLATALSAPLAPDAGGNGSAEAGFHVQNGRLLDSTGEDFIIRGVNNNHISFFEEALVALPAIEEYGFNTVRINWRTDRAESTAEHLEIAIDAVIEHGLVAMPALHDTERTLPGGQKQRVLTGGERVADLIDVAVGYWTRPEIKKVLNSHRQHVLINIANEWGTSANFLFGYKEAITRMRDAGLNHTLVIDAPGWGQDHQTLRKHAKALLDHDPLHNLVFSLHMYGNVGYDSQLIIDIIKDFATSRIPFLIGEFGWYHGDPSKAIDFRTIMSACRDNGVGFLPWIWKTWDSDGLYMTWDWGGEHLTWYGREVIFGPHGIKATSRPPCSMDPLQPACSPCTNIPPTGSKYSCDQHAAWGQCDEPWVGGAGRCNLSCGRCQVPCTNIPVDEHSCDDQAAWGKCDEPWMTAYPGYCNRSCGRCQDPCTDKAGAYSCAQQAAWGKCNEPWMEGYCDRTCGRCVNPCTDIAPDQRYSCAQQAAWGKCSEPWMQGYCDSTCGRCVSPCN